MTEKQVLRFINKIKVFNDCWVWIGSKTPNGYGTLNLFGKKHYAHRISYILYKKEIPKGLSIDHLCRNTSCVNPAHLEAVTHRENIRRGKRYNRDKTHCKNGHEFTKENTYIWKGRPKARYCRKCNNS